MKVIQLFKNQTKLIACAANNSREAQEELYRRYSGKMLSLCRMYIKDLHHAEEVMLNGFLKVFRHISSFQNQGSFEGWVRKIMIREAISFLRSKKEMDFAQEVFENTHQSFNNISSGIEVEHIQQLIDSLPEGYKVVFVLYAIEGYKHQEISKMLGITEGTSKSQLFKARKMLQEKLKTQSISEYGTVKI